MKIPYMDCCWWFTINWEKRDFCIYVEVSTLTVISMLSTMKTFSLQSTIKEINLEKKSKDEQIARCVYSTETFMPWNPL